MAHLGSSQLLLSTTLWQPKFLLVNQGTLPFPWQFSPFQSGMGTNLSVAVSASREGQGAETRERFILRNLTQIFGLCCAKSSNCVWKHPPD